MLSSWRVEVPELANLKVPPLCPLAEARYIVKLEVVREVYSPPMYIKPPPPALPERVSWIVTDVIEMVESPLVELTQKDPPSFKFV